ncbi:MAG: energy transducer TonB, partial [Acidobacteriota bacterium]
FNLAFYLTTLLKEDLQREEGERVREEAFIEKSPADPQPSANHPILSRPPDPARSRTRRKRFITFAGIVLVILLVAAAAAAYLKMRAGPLPSGQPDAGASTQPVPQGMALTGLASSAANDRIGSRRDSTVPGDRVGTDRPVSEAPARGVEPGESHPGRIDRLKVGSARGVDKNLETELSAAALDERRLRERQSAEATNESQQNLPTPTPVTTRVGDLVSLSEVDQIPQVVVSFRPPYPGIAQRQHLQATIALSALISETGSVLDVRVVRPAARLSSLEAAAIQSVKTWQFSPAIKDGKAVRTWMNVSVSFTMK